MTAALKPDTCLHGSHVLPRCIICQLIRAVHESSCASQVERIYLVQLRDETEGSDFFLNLDEVFVLDHKSREVERGQVIRNENITDDTDPKDLRLRIW